MCDRATDGDEIVTFDYKRLFFVLMVVQYREMCCGNALAPTFVVTLSYTPSDSYQRKSQEGEAQREKDC